MIYYLGIPEPSWLSTISVPAFVSRNRLMRMRNELRPSPVPLAIDSGGFSELTPMPGQKVTKRGWTLKAKHYAAEMDYYRRALVNVDWMAPQDWMTEDAALANTGMSLREHQLLTTNNFLELEAAAPWLHFVPVLQGRTVDDYLRHADDYERAGIDLAKRRRVGVGSVCRRQGCNEAIEILRALHKRGMRLHAFGFSTLGVRNGAQYIASADSMAWSLAARQKHVLLPGHFHGSKTPDCRNCPAWALLWRKQLLDSVDPRYVQEHPHFAMPSSLLRLYTKELVSSSNGRPRRGMPTPRELALMVAECREVVQINRTLDEEEDVEEERGAHLERVPETYRAVLSEPTRRSLEALDPPYLRGLGPNTRHTILLALAMKETGGPWPPPNPAARVRTRDGTKIRPADCLPKKFASMTLRAGAKLASCDPKTAGWVLGRWKSKEYPTPPRVEELERQLG